jgi:hypothetical protein
MHLIYSYSLKSSLSTCRLQDNHQKYVCKYIKISEWSYAWIKKYVCKYINIVNLTKSEYKLLFSNEKYFYGVNIPITSVRMFLSSLSYILNDRSELNLTINEEETVKVNERMGWNFAQEND